MNQKSMKKLKIAAIVLGVVFLISVIVGLIVINNNRSSGVSKTAKKKIQIQFDTTRVFLLAKVTS